MNTHIFSVFGQCERVAANIMIDAGKAEKIERKDFPEGAPTVNDAGVEACFAVLLKSSKLRKEYDSLCAELRW